MHLDMSMILLRCCTAQATNESDKTPREKGSSNEKKTTKDLREESNAKELTQELPVSNPRHYRRTTPESLPTLWECLEANHIWERQIVVIQSRSSKQTHAREEAVLEM